MDSPPAQNFSYGCTDNQPSIITDPNALISLADEFLGSTTEKFGLNLNNHNFGKYKINKLVRKTLLENRSAKKLNFRISIVKGRFERKCMKKPLTSVLRKFGLSHHEWKIGLKDFWRFKWDEDRFLGGSKIPRQFGYGKEQLAFVAWLRDNQKGISYRDMTARYNLKFPGNK
jgi:hypothetical protein